MKRLIIKLFLSLCLWAVLPVCAQDAVHYYFRTMDIRNGLSQNTVYQILQDRKGFMWFGTKDGLNRYDGLSFRVYKKENSGLGKNFITALYEDRRGNIWIGTDGGVFIYDPVLDSFTAFDEASDNGSIIRDFVTMIGSDEDDNIWISVENQGLFCYKPDEGRLLNHLHDSGLPNVTRFWLNGNTCWLALYADNLYYTKADFETPLQPFKDAEGNEIFKNDIINWQVSGPHNCVYIASLNGLTEINQTTGKTRKLLNTYVRALQFTSSLPGDCRKRPRYITTFPHSTSGTKIHLYKANIKRNSAGNGYSGLLPNGTGVTSIIWTLLSKTMKAKQRTAITSRNTIFPPPCYTGC